jgi:hypothetical protein
MMHGPIFIRLRSGVFWQVALKQIEIKQVEHKIRAVCTAENELQMGGKSLVACTG